MKGVKAKSGTKQERKFIIPHCLFRHLTPSLSCLRPLRWRAVFLRLFFILVPLLSCIVLFWFSLPKKLFSVDYSTVLLDRNGYVLGATIADDDQWRFPPVTEVPEKFKQALIVYEDRRFYKHMGVDPLAVMRAIKQNIEAGEIVSGASTLTMQLMRLSRQNHKRTVIQKIFEMVLSVRIEFAMTKEEILAAFVSHAPFGGNVVGLEAASWRYFGRGPESLSWAEHTTLAVLPNNPALIHPGRNRDLLLQKRNWLLDMLLQEGIIDETVCRLAQMEELPPNPFPFPKLAPHLLFHARSRDRMHSWVRSTMDNIVQRNATEILNRHHRYLSGIGIRNAASLILDVNSGGVISYVGNVGDFNLGVNGNQVDIVRSPRSTGSLLKPLLYAAMLQSGDILPGQLVADVPTRYGSFMPQNYSRGYEGAVPAYRALARSLNIPAVRMLQSYGVDRFYSFLKELGISTLYRPADEYGLSLILGGAESTLWEITGIYAGMARTVNNYSRAGTSSSKSFVLSTYTAEHEVGEQEPQDNFNYQTYDVPLSAGVCWLTLKAMVDVERPETENAWREYSSSQNIAWKTGTSFGYRDAWAVGVTPKYAIGVWVGNADGEGHANLIGSQVAAPILFELFDMLDKSHWFAQPHSDLLQIEVCTKSGYRAGIYCEEKKYQWVPKSGLKALSCPYCRNIHLDPTMMWRVNSSCEKITRMHSENWFVLPPAMEYFYKKRHSGYRPIPPFSPDCTPPSHHPDGISISIIYPTPGSAIYVPLELDGTKGKTVFQAAHRRPDLRIFWHLDESYMGFTAGIHQMDFSPNPGPHVLTLVDENGELVQRQFTILSKEQRE
jgi:penicillin-binding protein 1C